MAFIVHTDMKIDLSFDVGKLKVRVALALKAGDDAELVLSEFMRCERVPIYLEGNILCVVHTLLQQERNSWQCTDYGRVECEENVLSWVENFQQQHKRQVWDGIMSMEADGIGELHEKKAKDAAFASKFHALVTSSPSALEKVLDMERQYTVALGHTVAAQDEARQEMQQRHGREMETAGKHRDSDDVTRLTMKHSAESDKLEEQYKVQIEEELASQREKYRAGIEKLAFAEVLSRLDADEGSKDQSLLGFFENQAAETEKPVEELPRAPSEEPPVPPTFDQEPPVATSSLGLFSLFRRGTTNDEENVLAGTDERRPGGSRKGPEEFIFNASYGKLVGPAFTIVVQEENLEELLTGKMEKPIWAEEEKASMEESASEQQDPRVETLLTLYSDTLVGAIVLSDLEMCHTPTQDRLDAICLRSPELHFDSFNRQKAVVAEGGSLDAGDFFITRHSSFKHLHSLFHLVAAHEDLTYHQDGPMLYDHSPMLSGLTRILECANQCGISRLYIPLLLLDHGWQEAIQDPNIRRRAEQVLFRVRSFFLDHTASRDGSLKSVHFMVPNTEEEEFETHCAELVRQVFRTDY